MGIGRADLLVWACLPHTYLHLLGESTLELGMHVTADTVTTACARALEAQRTTLWLCRGGKLHAVSPAVPPGGGAHAHAVIPAQGEVSSCLAAPTPTPHPPSPNPSPNPNPSPSPDPSPGPSPSPSPSPSPNPNPKPGAYAYALPQRCDLHAGRGLCWNVRGRTTDCPRA